MSSSRATAISIPTSVDGILAVYEDDSLERLVARRAEPDEPRLQLREQRADRVLDRVAAHAPGLRDLVVATDVITPADLAAYNPNAIAGDPYAGSAELDQNFLWRDTPATWRVDAILAATQTALLPDAPAEVREGWIRVAPDEPAPSAGGGTP